MKKRVNLDTHGKKIKRHVPRNKTILSSMLAKIKNNLQSELPMFYSTIWKKKERSD